MILIKHTFGNNTDLFLIARASKESHVLRIPTDIGIKFSLVLEQEYDAGISMAALSKEARGSKLLLTRDCQKSECCYILGQFPVDRRETLEPTEKLNLFSVFRFQGFITILPLTIIP